MYSLKRIFLFIFLAPIWIPLFILFILIVPPEEFEEDFIYDIIME